MLPLTEEQLDKNRQKCLKIQILNPRSKTCKQVSRLSFILIWRLPVIYMTVTCVPFRPLHGYWDSPEISSAFPWHLNDASILHAVTLTIHLGRS